MATHRWPGVACPLGPEPFSEQDIAPATEDERTWMEMENARADTEKCIGVDNDGWVETEEYDRAVQASNNLRKAWMASRNHFSTEYLRSLQDRYVNNCTGIASANSWIAMYIG